MGCILLMREESAVSGDAMVLEALAAASAAEKAVVGAEAPRWLRVFLGDNVGAGTGVEGIDCILVILLGGTDWPTGRGPAAVWTGWVPGVSSSVPMRAAAYVLEPTRLDLEGEPETEVWMDAVWLAGLGGNLAFPGEVGCEVSAIYDMISETLFQATSDIEITHLKNSLDSTHGVGLD
jgi:hypothetical protein